MQVDDDSGAGRRLVPRPEATRRTDPLIAALDEGAEAVRLANHAARDGLVEVVGLYGALGSVVTLVDRLPQVVLFAQRCAMANGTAGLVDDTGRDPGERLVEFIAWLGEGHAGLLGAGRALGRGHAALSHLGHRPVSA
ncbi:hypothetical protein GCM10023203_27280 [Actinomycetospora straminea]|uniref:Uncharacterized protein n=1 Tax=Actinomycetospora straminea TaxID=663607 RepID=A0ABP9ECS8_9PSEU